MSRFAASSSTVRAWVAAPPNGNAETLENIGATELIFLTVEFLDGQNKPLPLSQSAR
jgi:hypothetical protein